MDKEELKKKIIEEKIKLIVMMYKSNWYFNSNDFELSPISNLALLKLVGEGIFKKHPSLINGYIVRESNKEKILTFLVENGHV